MTQRNALFVFQILVAIAIVLGGCNMLSHAPIDANLANADSHAGDIGKKVDKAANQISGSARNIIDAAQQGKQKTPDPAHPILDPYWNRIEGEGHNLTAQGDVLTSIHTDIEGLRSEVKAGEEKLTQTTSDLEAEKAGRASDNAAWEKKLASAKSSWESGFRIIAWLAIVSIGISVAIGVLMHDYSISIAGGAGGITVVIACMIVGQALEWLPYITGGIILAVVIWVGIEAYFRGGIWNAIKAGENAGLNLIKQTIPGTNTASSGTAATPSTPPPQLH